MNQNDPLINKQIEDIKNEAINTLAKLSNLYGLSHFESRLFSIMFLEDNPMTLDEMSNTLGMSKTSMSTGIRSLVDTQLVERTWKKGIRKDLYVVEEDLYKNFSNVFIDEWLSIVQHNTKTFIKISDQLKNITENNIEDPSMKEPLTKYSQKIDSIIHFYRWLTTILKDIQGKIEDQQT